MFNKLQPERPKAAAAAAALPLKHNQTSLQNAFSQKSSRYTGAMSALKSSHGPPLSSVLNKNVPHVQRPRPQEKVIEAFESSSFADSGIVVSSMESTQVKPQTQMSALHEAVFFDEEDFDDDGDLDFDDSVVYSASPASHRVPTPPLPEKRSPTPVKRCHDSIINKNHTKTATTQLAPTNSSQPLPWSSSPVESLHPPPPPLSEVPTEVIDLCDEPEEAPKPKKRKIPWAGKTGGTVPGSMFSRAIHNASKPTKPKATRAEAPSGKTQFPWDMTASDVKKASSVTRKRSEQRRGMSTAAGSEEVVGKKKTLKQKKLTLSSEQMHVLDLVLESGKSVFFTGSAGTGKSVLMREVIASLRRKYAGDSDRVAVTASTGLAACNVGGVTLHSFAGIGLGKEPVPDLVKKIRRNPKAKTRWLRTKVLVIDEISMVDGELFDKLEAIARNIRNNGRAFGGIQLVITGDFFQLPPVPDYGKVSRFAFDADTWNTTIEHTIGLTQVFRQKDPEFAAILNEMRLGKLSAASVAVFRRLHRPLTYDDGIQATELFPTRQEVDAANNNKMRLLSGDARKFTAEDSGTIIDKVHRDKLLSNCMAPPVIELKVNSQVMLIKNLDETLVNGSLGRVVGFMNEKTFDLVQDDPEAWAETLRNIEGEETNASKKLAALARVTGNDNSTAKVWPLVEFALPDGTSRQLLVQPEQWKVELPSGEVQASRSQVPLILAWALSIHKAQGQTLERVKVDLGRVFEKGQAYVALSRATCQEGLQVLRFDASKVMAHEKVREFYKSLYSAAEANSKKGARVDEYPDADEEEEMMRMMGG